MATIKSFTDLQQSKKLAEILPLESADMYWWSSGKRHYIEAMNDGDFNEQEGHVRAWSLAALLGVLPYPSIHKHADETWWCDAWVDKVNPYSLRHFKTPVDACVTMIEELHEQKLL